MGGGGWQAAHGLQFQDQHDRKCQIQWFSSPPPLAPLTASLPPFSLPQGMVFMILGWRLVPKYFGGIAVALLPFEPPAFFQKATHRGLTDAGPREASAIFIFMLAQASLRAVLPKVLGWGPTRRMTLVKPHIPKAMKMD